MGERMTYRSFPPLPCSTRMTIRLRSISVSLSDTTLRGSQAGGISQAQDRPVLDVRRRGEQPTDLLRAQNNGQARLTGRDELLGKIVAFQGDLEEEPQGSGADVGGSHRRPARGQPQLIAMDILDGGLVGRPAEEIGKLFDVADILVVRLGTEPADRHVLDQSPA